MTGGFVYAVPERLVVFVDTNCYKFACLVFEAHEPAPDAITPTIPGGLKLELLIVYNHGSTGKDDGTLLWQH